MSDPTTSRSRNMARVRSKGTEPEIAVRKILYGLGFRYRLNAPELPGRPDIVNRKRRVAVFVHGCFWHGHTCKRGTLPKSNADFWTKKIERNRNRDAKVAAALEAGGYRVVVIWECELRHPLEVVRVLRSLTTTR